MAAISRLIVFFILIFPFCVCLDENEATHEILLQRFLVNVTAKQMELLSNLEDTMKVALTEDTKNTINHMKAVLKEDLQHVINDMKAELKQDIDNTFNELKTEDHSSDNCCSGTRNDVATLQHLLDIDECIAGTHNCSSDASCIDTMVSFRCKCKPGYEGDGYTCQDEDECTKVGRCDPDATCTNSRGSYICKCNPGYKGNGTTCQDVDECYDRTHQCHVHAICTNTVGNYTCSCTIFHEGDGYTCQEIKVTGCPSPFKLYQTIGCIYINAKDRNFKESRGDCKAIGGDIFVAESHEHYLRLAQHFKDINYRNTRRYMYVGVKDGFWLNGRRVAHQETVPRDRRFIRNSACASTDGDGWEFQFHLMIAYCNTESWAICENTNKTTWQIL